MEIGSELRDIVSIVIELFSPIHSPVYFHFK